MFCEVLGHILTYFVTCFKTYLDMFYDMFCIYRHVFALLALKGLVHPACAVAAVICSDMSSKCDSRGGEGRGVTVLLMNNNYLICCRYLCKQP